MKIIQVHYFDQLVKVSLFSMIHLTVLLLFICLFWVNYFSFTSLHTISLRDLFLAHKLLFTFGQTLTLTNKSVSLLHINNFKDVKMFMNPFRFVKY